MKVNKRPEAVRERFIENIRQELKRLTNTTYCDRVIARFIVEVFEEFHTYISTTRMRAMLKSPDTPDFKPIQRIKGNFNSIESRTFSSAKLLADTYPIALHDHYFNKTIYPKYIGLFIRRLIKDERTDIQLIHTFLTTTNETPQEILHKEGRAFNISKKQEQALNDCKELLRLNDAYVLKYTRKLEKSRKGIVNNNFIVKVFKDNIDITKTIKTRKRKTKVVTIDYYSHQSFVFQDEKTIYKSNFTHLFIDILNNIDLNLPLEKPKDTEFEYQLTIGNDIHIYTKDSFGKTEYKFFYRSIDITLAVCLKIYSRSMTIEKSNLTKTHQSLTSDKDFYLDMLPHNFKTYCPELFNLRK